MHLQYDGSDWYMKLPARKSFRGDWTQEPKEYDYRIWRPFEFAPWNGRRRKHWRDRFEWRTQFFGDDRRWPGRFTLVYKQGSILLDLHEEREERRREELGEKEGY
jgi:hypothetical protein